MRKAPAGKLRAAKYCVSRNCGASVAGVSGLRERKKEATRRALALAAIRLAVSGGLPNLLVDDIAAEAGVSARTFNNYFSSKYEAICALAVDRARRMGRVFREYPGGDLWGAVRHALHTEYDSHQAPEPAWINGVRLVTGAPELQGEYRKALLAVRRELAGAIAERLGCEPDALRPVVLAGAIADATELITDRWLAGDPPGPIAPYIDDVVDELSTIVNP